MSTPCDVCENVEPNWDRGWWVSDEEWLRIVPEKWQNKTLCPWCFKKFALQQGYQYKVRYTNGIAFGVEKINMLCPPKLLKENFPNDMNYTFHALVEQLALMELHIRDGSWRLCNCNPEKHLPIVAGLASEGFGFAENEDERHFMECLMNQSRVFKTKIRSGEYKSQVDMNAIKDWAREARHRLEAKNWSGEWRRLETCEDPVEIMEDITEIIGELKKKAHATAAHVNDADDFLVLEREMAENVIAKLSEKYGVEPPELFINDKCYKPMIGLYTADRIMVCKTGVNLHVLAHEFWHHVQKERGMHMDEGAAEKFAIELFAAPHQKALYANHAHSHTERKMVKSIKEVGVIYGLQQVGFGANYALKLADIQVPLGFLGQPISLWGDLLGTVGGILGALYLKSPYDLVAAIVGGYMSTDLWNQLVRLTRPTLVATPPPLVYTPGSTVVKPTPVVAPTLAAPIGRYQITA